MDQVTTTLPVETYLRRVHRTFSGLKDGAVADYIPPLAAADPEPFGICVVTVDGQVYAVGDSDAPFTIQSISKPFTYALALADRGLPEVRRRIGVEPSGDAFNSISLDSAGRPRNPMINAGAIAAAGLVDGGESGDPAERLVESLGVWAGRRLEVDEEVFAAEQETGHRNRAIGHMLRAVGSLDGDPERALDVYFRACSVEVTCRDLAVMAATLAGRGLNPLTGARAVPDALVTQVLSVMTTCGMYDAAGEWLVNVGIPAKSGVGGGVIGVMPGQLGVAVFSPRLDAVGNSVRGVAVFNQLARDLRLHFVNTGRTQRAAIRVRLLSETPSARQRPAEQRGDLAAASERCIVVEAGGDLLFAGAEAVSREALAPGRRLVLLDLHRAQTIDAAAAQVLAELARQLSRSGGELVVAGAHDVTAAAIGARLFHDPDAAREWCEDKLLGKEHAPVVLGPGDHPLVGGLPQPLREELEGITRVHDFVPDEQLVEAGTPAQRVHLLLAGDVVVSVPTAGGARRRLASIGPGATFGESALALGGVHTADVHGATAGRCLVLDVAALEGASAELQVHLLRSFLGSAFGVLSRVTRDSSTAVPE
ncbi:glutaminase A [Nocardioides KLBMP 9356]|uniref:Glutaminase n=1 Tax=Nocardioides potassii TaxID=2911371 RepID=A0ABS9HEE0_9ACTN|nr:glutaminase A [Nocardioides potassii]MCF6378718.1 glutaminase A [Nocardioides potassii]